MLRLSGFRQKRPGTEKQAEEEKKRLEEEEKRKEEAAKVQEADHYYTAILKANPKHPDANHNLAVLLISSKRTSEALTFFKAALQSNSKTEQFSIIFAPFNFAPFAKTFVTPTGSA